MFIPCGAETAGVLFGRGIGLLPSVDAVAAGFHADIEMGLETTGGGSAILPGKTTRVLRFEGRLILRDAGHPDDTPTGYLGPAIRVRSGQEEAALDLPRGDFGLPLAIQDRTFDEEKRLNCLTHPINLFRPSHACKQIKYLPITAPFDQVRRAFETKALLNVL